eukprot:COSAG04_NODE_18638_length_436_cov_0.771513_2_plen_111_part_01
MLSQVILFGVALRHLSHRRHTSLRVGGSSVIRRSVEPYGIIVKFAAPPETSSSTGVRKDEKTPWPGSGAAAGLALKVKAESLETLSGGSGWVRLIVISQVNRPSGVANASG